MIDQEVSFAKRVAEKQEDKTIEALEKSQTERLGKLINQLIIQQKNMLNSVVEASQGSVSGGHILERQIIDSTGLEELAINGGLVHPELAVENRKNAFLSYINSLKSTVEPADRPDAHSEVSGE